MYLITIADAYYSTLLIEPKAPPQHQTIKASAMTTIQVR